MRKRKRRKKAEERSTVCVREGGNVGREKAKTGETRGEMLQPLLLLTVLDGNFLQ